MARTRKWKNSNKASQSWNAEPTASWGEITSNWSEAPHGVARTNVGWGESPNAWEEPIAGAANTSNDSWGEVKTEAVNTFFTNTREFFDAWGEPIAGAANASNINWGETGHTWGESNSEAANTPLDSPGVTLDGWRLPISRAAKTCNDPWHQVEPTVSGTSNGGWTNVSSTSQGEWQTCRQNSPVESAWDSYHWTRYDRSQGVESNRPLGCDCTEDTSPNGIEHAKNLKLINAKRAHEEIKNKVDGWPWVDVPEQLVTLGPYLPNYYHRDPWSLPKAEQSSPLFRILQIDLLRGKILDNVMINHFDAASFATSCRSAYVFVAAQITFWDMSDGWFNNCENSRFGPGSSDKAHRQGSVQSVLLVTPVRHPKSALAQAPGNEGLYSRQLGNLKTMVRSIHNFSDFMYNVQFHRVPFLTIELVNLLIPGLRNLKVLGVYKCLLINIGHTIKLLDIIKEDKPLEKENQVYLDFFPNYHIGPTCAGHEGWTGSYGVLWDNWGGDTRLAIWALVSKILPRALAQGINLIAPGTAFLKWLELSPCWRVEETIKAIMALELDPKERVALIDWPHYFGSIENMTARYLRRPEGWRWSVRSYRCQSCTKVLLGCFFPYSEIREARNANELDIPEPPVRCLGCKLEVDLEAERDHFKRAKLHTMRKWLREEEFPADDSEILYNTTNVPRALEAFDERNIDHTARSLDRLRRRAMNSGPLHLRWDREIDERQRHKTSAEQGRHGHRLMAPEVGAYDLWLVGTTLNDEESKWWGFPHQRYCGFGNYIEQ